MMARRFHVAFKDERFGVDQRSVEVEHYGLRAARQGAEAFRDPGCRKVKSHAACVTFLTGPVNPPRLSHFATGSCEL
jgi:hypothetical protein